MRKKKIYIGIFFLYIGFPTGRGLKTGPPPRFFFEHIVKKNLPGFFLHHLGWPKWGGTGRPKIFPKIILSPPWPCQRRLWGRIFFWWARPPNFFFDFSHQPMFFFTCKIKPTCKKNPTVFFYTLFRESEKKLGEKTSPGVKKILKIPFWVR